MNLQTRYDLTRLIKDKKYKIGVELGVREGYFSYYLLKHSPLNKLYSVDNWKGRWQNGRLEALKMLSFFGGRSEVLEMRTTEAYDHFVKKGITPDFVYVDANHKYSAVKEDIEKWYSILRVGGTLAGHDYIDGEGVVPAVDEFIAAHPELELNLTEEHMKSWWIVKK